MDPDDEKALKTYNKQRLKAENKGNLDNEASISNYIGDIYEKYGNFDQAIKEHERALRLREAVGRKIDVAVAFRTLGECYCRKKDFEKAHVLHEKYLDLARECDNVVEQQRALTTIGNTFLEHSGDKSLSNKTKQDLCKRAEKAYLKSLEICDHLKDKIEEKEFVDMKARNYYNLGMVYDVLEDTETSKQYLNKALSLCQNHHLVEMLYVCQKALGDIYLKYSRLEDAEQFLDAAYKTAKQLDSKTSKTECLLLKTQVSVHKKDMSLARHLLKKAHKLNKIHAEEAEKIMVFYRSVVTMEKTLEKLQKTSKEDLVLRVPLYEKLGDCAASIKMYTLAISYYNKMLRASTEANVASKELVPIYVSLAQTYADCSQYDKAIVFYKKEIECYGEGSHEQVCNSWLNIAAYEEKIDTDYRKVQVSYVNAHNAAKKAGNRQLQCRALTCLLELFKINKDEKLLKKVQDQLGHIRQKYGIRDSDLEESQVTDDGEEHDHMLEEESDVEMSDLTESEEEELAVKTIKISRRNGSKAKFQKRTDFGETPLQVACIKGDLDKVKKLIAEGHPVNVQDFSGWSPLHEAANHNWYDITEYLLQHGADIDHRGGPKCQGMTPLIDAASMGWLDIVELLLKYGANALAKDDSQMTALDHLLKLREESDALDRKTEIQFNNIVGMLREKTPAYRGMPRNAILSQFKEAALVPKSNIQNNCKNASSPESSQSLPTISRRRHKEEKRKSRNDIIVESDSDTCEEISQKSRKYSSSQMDSDDSENVYPSLSDDADDIDQNPTEAYRSAISKVGQSACRSSQVKPSQKTSGTASVPALIAEEEFIEDDWLIDDLKPTKRKKVDVNGYLSTGNIRKRSRSGSVSPQPISNEPRRDSSSRKKRFKIVNSDSEDDPVVTQNLDRITDTSLNDITNMDSEDEFNNTMIGGDDYIDVMFNGDIGTDVPSTASAENNTTQNKFSSKKVSQKQLKLTDFGQTGTSNLSDSNDKVSSVHTINSAISGNQTRGDNATSAISENSFTSSSHRSVLRVKVNVEGYLCFIPVEPGATFAWLAEKAATRYFQQFGVRLKLTLGKDGAHFSPEDPVSVMLVDNDMVDSFVDSKDELPAMTESYKNACSTLKTVCYKNVSTLLQSCEASGRLSLSDMALKTNRFQPVIRAIQHQTCLRELDIRGNRLCDGGLENLCKVLNTVPNLVYLNIACNEITVEGLESLCAVIASENNKALQNLTCLELSHNPLYDGCIVQLASLVKGLPLLSRLALSSCNLTVKLFQNDRLQLTEALHHSGLQHWDVSYNQLGCVGVELFLKCQNPTKILSLDMSHTISDARSGQVYRHIYNYASQDGCSLQDLKLCSCSLSLDDSDFLARLPVVSKNLQKLDISGNAKLTNQVLQQLLQSSAKESSNLEAIIARNTAIHSPLSVEFLDALAEKLTVNVPLRMLEFTCTKIEKLDIDSLSQVWRDRYGEFGKIEHNDDHVKLTVTNL